MPPSRASCFDPKVLARIRPVGLRARRAVEGLLVGPHPSPLRGISVEFASHRPYAQGDDLRHLDWRVYARSDRLNIREHDRETQATAALILDSTGSMSYGDEGWTKWDYAATVAASLGMLLLLQRDRVSLKIVGTAGHDLPPSSNPAYLHLLPETLDAIRPGGPSALGPFLDTWASSHQPKGFVIVVSDCLEDPAKLAEALASCRRRGHEVLLFQILHPSELQFPFSGPVRFEDLESGQVVTLDAGSWRRDYLEAMEKHQASLKQACQEAGVPSVLLNTADPLDQALASFLALYRGERRQGTSRHGLR